jgi:hypothetical protein
MQGRYGRAVFWRSALLAMLFCERWFFDLRFARRCFRPVELRRVRPSCGLARCGFSSVVFRAAALHRAALPRILRTAVFRAGVLRPAALRARLGLRLLGMDPSGFQDYVRHRDIADLQGAWSDGSPLHRVGSQVQSLSCPPYFART